MVHLVRGSRNLSPNSAGTAKPKFWRASSMRLWAMNARIRRRVHFAVADLLYYSGALVLWRFFRQRLLRNQDVCVLGLHRVLTKSEQSRSNSLGGMVLNDLTFIHLLEYL